MAADEPASGASLQKGPLNGLGSRQKVLVLAEIVVSEFRKPSSQESLSIPSEAETSNRGVLVSMNQRECPGTTGSNFH